MEKMTEITLPRELFQQGVPKAHIAEPQITLSVPKIYEVPAEKYTLRSKWQKNQTHGQVPEAEADVLLRPSLFYWDEAEFARQARFCCPQQSDLASLQE